MRKITLIMAYYENPTMLQKQIDNIAFYSKDILENLEIIIVDDCSPEKPALPVIIKNINMGKCYNIDIDLYRTLVDIRWNQDFCRNLAVYKTTTEWIFLTDIDHLIPEATFRHLMTTKEVSRLHAYRFQRKTAPDLTEYKPHPNTWFMTKETYQRAGGYDERFAGYYGTDGDFAARLAKVAPLFYLKEYIVRVPREHIADASTTRYERKTAEDKKRKSEIAEERKALKDWRPLNLQFPWERLL